MRTEIKTREGISLTLTQFEDTNLLQIEFEEGEKKRRKVGVSFSVDQLTDLQNAIGDTIEKRLSQGSGRRGCSYHSGICSHSRRQSA